MSRRPAPAARHPRSGPDAPADPTALALPDDDARWTEARVEELATFGHDAPDRLPLAVAFHAATGEAMSLPVDDPVLDLRGTEAPPGSVAAGVVAGGRAHALEGCSTPIEGRVGLALLVHRRGHLAVRVWDGDGDDLLGPGDRGGGPTGLVVDVCRRMLGAPTPPPDAGTEALLTVLWLSAVLDRAREVAPGTLSWPEVAAAHPAPALAADVLDALASSDGLAGPPGTPHDATSAADLDGCGTAEALDLPTLLEVACRHDVHVDGLAECCEVVAQLFPWSRVRAMARRAGQPILGISPREAGWFDDGSFARAAMAGLVPGSVLLDRLDAVLPAELHRSVRAVAEPQLVPPPIGADEANVGWNDR